MIEPLIKQAFRSLNDAHDPVRATAEFYISFSRIHPFYDANGRIARLLVNAYLIPRGLYLSWEAVDGSRGRFLQRVNECLQRFDQEGYERYLGYFVSYWRKQIRPLDSFFSLDVAGPDDQVPSD